MEEIELTKKQQLRKELSQATPNLRNDQIVALYDDYGLVFNMPDVDTYRLIALLAGAEEKILSLQEVENTEQ